jgi:hypothetical protein
MIIKHLNQKGQVLVFTTLMFSLLMFFVGFATDGGRAYLLKAELTRTVDAAAIAAASRVNAGMSAAQSAACDSAKMNGMSDCAKLTVTQVTVNDAAGNPKPSVKVTGTTWTPTIFLAVGKLLGCGALCERIDVAATAVAATGGLLDLVMNLDDTNSMSGAKLTAAKSGANALVDAVIPASSTSSVAKVAMVPFRGCYHPDPSSFPSSDARRNCKDSDEYPSGGGSISSLPLDSTNNNGTLHGAISVLNGSGGSGTNVCEGLTRARQKLFESPPSRSRDNAKKFIVLLTDADNSYNTGTGSVVSAGCFPAGSTDSTRNRSLGVKSYDLATNIKTGVSGGGQPSGSTVTIFVILYGDGAQSGVSPYASCTELTIQDPNGNARYMKTLAQCMASTPGDLYLAPNANDISAAFQQIISRLPVLLIN